MEQLLIDLAAVLAAASPLVIAAMGETLSERAGVINLSLDGTMLLSAMTGFAVALITGNLILGFIAAFLGLPLLTFLPINSAGLFLFAFQPGLYVKSFGKTVRHCDACAHANLTIMRRKRRQNA